MSQITVSQAVAVERAPGAAVAASEAQAEAHVVSHATSLGVHSHKLAMWLFIASESMFFAALIATYMVNRNRVIAGPTALDIFDIPLTTISTFVLLMSSLTMALAVHATHKGDRRGQILFLATTIAAGLIFLRFQVYEFTHFSHAGLGLSTSVFGSSFYVLTGFHGAHVALGILWLTTLLISALRGNLQHRDPVMVEVAGLYWHFVDIVWIAVFTIVYLLTEASKITL